MRTYAKEYEETTGKPYHRLFNEDLHPALYKLWTRRNEDAPITTRELYEMLENVAEEFEYVISLTH